jgi:hypothetical protein
MRIVLVTGCYWMFEWCRGNRLQRGLRDIAPQAGSLGDVLKGATKRNVIDRDKNDDVKMHFYPGKSKN